MSDNKNQAILKKASDLCGEERYREAFSLYSSLMQKGDLEGTRFVAWMYLLGAGVEKDIRKGKGLLEDLAMIGDDEAQFGLGKTYEETGDYCEARKWYSKSMEQGFHPSGFRLALLWLYGHGGDEDVNQAFKLFKAAADIGSIAAKVRCSRLLIKGYKGIFGITEGVQLAVSAILSTFYCAIFDRSSNRTMSSYPWEFRYLTRKL